MSKSDPPSDGYNCSWFFHKCWAWSRDLLQSWSALESLIPSWSCWHDCSCIFVLFRAFPSWRWFDILVQVLVENDYPSGNLILQSKKRVHWSCQDVSISLWLPQVQMLALLALPALSLVGPATQAGSGRSYACKKNHHTKPSWSWFTFGLVNGPMLDWNYFKIVFG